MLSVLFATEAEVRWLDHAEATIARARRSGAIAPVGSGSDGLAPSAGVAGTAAANLEGGVR